MIHQRKETTLATPTGEVKNHHIQGVVWEVEQGSNGNAAFSLFWSTLPLLTLAQAQGGAVLIDKTRLVWSTATPLRPTRFGDLELNEVLGSSANVTVTLLVQTLDGEVLSNQTQAVSELLAGEVRNVSVSFADCPTGLVLIAALTGEVRLNNSQLVDTVSATVQPRPLPSRLEVLEASYPKASMPTDNPRQPLF